jgi:hydrogenase nickel incorporation protein HypA/HybF
VHELSLASAIASIASDHARGRRVTRVEVRVGALRQVVPEALTFAFELVVEGTELDGAELALEHVPVRVRCVGCGAEGEPNAFPLLCTACGSTAVQIGAGDELLVESLELEDDVVTELVEGR